MSLYTRSRGVKPTLDPLEVRREEALVQSLAARIVMVRRKAEQMRDTLVVRDTHQAEITTAAVEVITQLAGAALEGEILEALAADIGDVTSQALKVTK